MRIYGLSGKSGTGKSYNSIEICSRLGISAIIDDGLFIYENSVVEGISAKKQDTKVGAIKTALFTNQAHADAVSRAIIKKKPEAILVIGTSDRMVDKICERLRLPQPSEHLHIDSIISKEQMERASDAREHSGMHTIPAPTFELKKQFSGYFLDATRAFRDRFGNSKAGGSQKTIVRPTYSYLGSYNVSDKVIEDIAKHAISKTPGAAALVFSSCSKEEEGMYIRIIMVCNWGAKVRQTARAVQKMIYKDVAFTTAYNILGLSVEVRGFR